MSNNLPEAWLRVRAIDFHESVKWAIVFVALSQYDEMFVYDEINPDPGKNTTTTIAELIRIKSAGDRFRFNLIDPLAAKNQVRSNTSVVQDLNMIFRTYQREGLCTGGVWEGWDTKNVVGRDKLRERIINSTLCGVPFNNEQVVRGHKQRLPTLWVLSNCRQTANSLHKWRLDKNGKPEQNHSHFCTALEAILKDVRFRPRIDRPSSPVKRAKEYFKVRR